MYFVNFPFDQQGRFGLVAGQYVHAELGALRYIAEAAPKGRFN